MQKNYVRILALLMGVIFALSITACTKEEHIHNHIYTIVKDSTCAEKGQMEGICDSCGDKHYQDIEMKKHEYVWGIFKEPTCLEKGISQGVCKGCGDKQYQEIDLSSCEYAWTISKQPTCVDKGVVDGICIHCGDNETKTIKENGHKFGNSICSVCNEIEGTVSLPIGEKLGWTAETLDTELKKINSSLYNLLYTQINTISISSNGILSVNLTYNSTFSFAYRDVREEFIIEQGITDKILNINLVMTFVDKNTVGALQISDEYYLPTLEITYLDGEKLQVGSFGVEGADINSIAINKQNELLVVKKTGTVAKYGTFDTEDVAMSDNVLIYRKLNENEYAVEGVYNKDVQTVVIPATHKGLKVVAISAWAFYNNDNIVSVVIGENVETIEQGAFLSCSSLTTVTISKSVKTIGRQAFAWCDLVTVNYGGSAFDRDKITIYDSNESLTSIEWNYLGK